MSDVVIVAMTVADLPNPPVPSTEKKCEDCGESVWVAKKQIMNAEMVDDNTKAICMNCYKERISDESR